VLQEQSIKISAVSGHTATPFLVSDCVGTLSHVVLSKEKLLYIYIYMYTLKKKINRKLAIEK
jgi:hypothetical protein